MRIYVYLLPCMYVFMWNKFPEIICSFMLIIYDYCIYRVYPYANLSDLGFLEVSIYNI